MIRVETNGRTDGQTDGGDCITSLANADGVKPVSSFLFNCICRTATADASDGEKRLHEHIFDGYNTQVRPRHNPKQPVVVDVDLNLHHLVKLVRQRGWDEINVYCT